MLVAVRNLLKQRFYSILNITGLGIGLSVFFVIMLYIGSQLGYDRFHANSDRLYRIDQTFIWGDAYPTFGSTGPGVADVMRNDVPGVEKVSRIYTVGDRLVSIPAKTDMVAYEEVDVFAVDSTFLDLFSFPLIYGEKESALNEPFSIVLTESTALRYFGKTDVLGEMLKVADGRNDGLFKVTGVVKDVPPNSHFTFNFVLSMGSFPEVAKRNTTWFWSGFVTYVLLHPDANPGQVKEVIYNLPEQKAGEQFKEVVSNGRPWNLFLVPVTDIWLHSTGSPSRTGATSNILYIYVLSAIAVMVLVLAIVNYMNIATARSIGRAKEVGVRKVMGALKGQLLVQFLSESFVLVILSAALALGMVELSLPYFNTLAGIELTTSSLFDSAEKVYFLLGIVILTAFLAGLYPAFYMTRFQPIQALRKLTKAGKGGKNLRSGLVIFQFTISITLIVLSFLVYDQLQYLQNKDLGFDKTNLIIVPQVQRMDSAKRVSFRETLANYPGVKSVGMSTSVPPNIWDGDGFSSDVQPDKQVPLNYMNVNDTYLQTLDVEILYGRGFGKQFEGDRQSVVLNENAVNALGWPVDETVVGKKLGYYGNKFTVIGIMKDFNYWTLESPIQPLAVFPYGAYITHQDTHFLSVRLNADANNSDGVQNFLTFLEAQWDQFGPGLPFAYQFTEDVYFQAFEFEQRLGKLFATFTYLAIIIAVIGLLGLAAYMAEVRMKEIGIRKVLGASVTQLVLLLSRDFARLVIIAFVVSIPLAWWAGNLWLENYQYRTTIDWTLFFYAGISALILALITVSYQSIKTAFTNPVDVLHNE